jgi:hypothetical protein
MTGGTIAYSVSLTSTAAASCVVEGRPWVRVPAEPYPVRVDELRSGEYGGGPGRSLTLHQGERVYAYVEMGRAPCNFEKSNAGTLRVEVGWASARVTTGGEACLDAGAVVLVGPFRRR